MTPKSFIALAALAGVSTIAASGATFVTATPTAKVVSAEPAFPDLRTDPNAVAKIEVTSNGGSFTIERGDDGFWTAPERHNYRVDDSTVRELVVNLADMQLVAAKTAKPERYSRLEVEDTDADDSQSRALRLMDAEGETIAEAVIGKRHFGMTGQSKQGTYIRRADEVQSWLASGGVRVNDQLEDWLSPDILNVARDTVKRVAMTPADGTAYVAAREVAEAAIEIIDIPEAWADAEPKPADRLLAVMANLTLSDVAPRSDIDFGEEFHRTKVQTFDGLEVNAELAEIEGRHWARFETEGDLPKGTATDLESWTFEISEHTFNRMTAPIGEWFEEADNGTS